jgi:hypothetical protein
VPSPLNASQIVSVHALQQLICSTEAANAVPIAQTCLAREAAGPPGNRSAKLVLQQLQAARLPMGLARIHLAYLNLPDPLIYLALIPGSDIMTDSKPGIKLQMCNSLTRLQ